MGQPAARQMTSVRYVPDQTSVGLAIALMASAWLAVLTGFVGTVSYLGPPGLVAVLAVCLMALSAVTATRWMLRLRSVRATIPTGLLGQRRYGDLDIVSTDEGRALRPVGMTVADLAARTDALLSPLTDIPSVRIFRSVRPAGTGQPVASHAISAGPVLLLLESVAWPPGSYQMDATGKIRCDGQYIGQSTDKLVEATNICRALLPRCHRVSALVVVHPTAEGTYRLPADIRSLGWVVADEMEDKLRARLARHHATVSRHTIAALASPTAGRAGQP